MLENAIQALQRGDHAAAERSASLILEGDPGHVEALRVRGWARLASGNADGGRTDIQLALALAPQRSDLQMALATMSMAQGDLNAALSLADSAVADDPNQLSAYVLQAHMAIAQGDLDEAERRVKLARRVAPDDPLSLLAGASLAQARGQEDAALAHLTRLVEIQPDSKVGLGALAQAYLRTGRHAFAEQVLRRTLQLHGPSVRNRWALVAALKGQLRHAEVLQEVQSLYTENPTPWFLAQRGLARLEAGHDQRGAKDLRRALLEAGPDSTLVRDVLEALAQVRRPGLAGQLVDALLMANPQHDTLWATRVDLAIQAGENAGAAIDKWVSLMPGSAAGNQYQAVRREADGRFDEALVAARRALEIDPSMAAASMVELRALVRTTPREALSRADELSRGEDPALRYTALMWKGLAADALGLADGAVEAWREMAAESGSQLPGSSGEGAVATVGPGSGAALARFLWGLPGSDVAAFAERLRANREVTLLSDRFGARPRVDGLDLRAGRPLPADAAARWARELRDQGIQPERVLDWIPHWTPDLDRVVPDAALLAVVRDPRDLLLNWWVFGSVQRFGFPGPERAAAWLAASLSGLADRLEGAPELTRLLRVDSPRDANEVAVAGFLGIAEDGLEPAPVVPPRLGGHDLRFPAGHWRRFSAPLSAAFAVLSPVAGRLGYSID